MQKYNITGSNVNIVEVNNGTIIVDGRSLAVRTEPQTNDQPRPVQGVDLPAFIHSPAYDQIQLHGRAFSFGSTQAGVIGRLHKASQTDTPWVLERDLMQQAGASSRNLHDLFRRHDRGFLFEKDTLGRVRLRL